MMFGVTESNQRRSHAPPCGKCFGWTRQDKERFAALFSSDIDVAPTHRLANPGAERLCHSFFPSKTRGQMALREFHRHGIFDLAGGENAMQETISEPLHGALDSCTLDNIDADTDHAHFVRPAGRAGIVGQAHRLPGHATATEAVALQFYRCMSRSFGIIRHCGEHFFHCRFQSDPHRPRDDGVTDVEFGQTWNLVHERDVFVIDAVTRVDLHMGF